MNRSVNPPTRPENATWVPSGDQAGLMTSPHVRQLDFALGLAALDVDDRQHRLALADAREDEPPAGRSPRRRPS